MYVTAQTQQIIALLHQKTLVAPLEEMTAALVPAVEKYCVSHCQPMHPTAQIRPMCLRHEVHMIPHQHKTKNGDVKASRRFCQQFYKPTAIAVIPKNPLPGVAAGANMIDGFLKFHSQRPRHIILVPEPRLMSNVKI